MSAPPLEANIAAEPARPERRRLSRPRLVLQVLAVGLVGTLLALLIWKTTASTRGRNLVADVRAGKKPSAPEFELSIMWRKDGTWPPALRRALADGKLSTSELRGYPAVLNFWASWCVPCGKEADELASSARAHAGKVVFLGLDIKDFRADGLRFLRRHEVPYVSIRDGGSSTYTAYGLTGLPETYYLDRRGRVVAHSLGQVSRRELEAGVAAAARREP
jgi:cytochrome c biogenesis protein CcmG/thiol:disulfide interchange protein DsbE